MLRAALRVPVLLTAIRNLPDFFTACENTT